MMEEKIGLSSPFYPFFRGPSGNDHDDDIYKEIAQSFSFLLHNQVHSGLCCIYLYILHT